MTETTTRPAAKIAGVKQKGELKTARIPIKIVPVDEPLKKPSWIRVKAGACRGRHRRTGSGAYRCRQGS